jgi:hypothetical protein
MSGIEWNDPALKELAIKGMVKEYEANTAELPYKKVMPVVNVKSKTFSEIVDKSTIFATPSTAAGASIQTVDLEKGLKSYTCGLHALTVPLLGEDRGLAPVDLVQDALFKEMDAARFAIEAEFENQLVSNIPTANKIDASSAQWADDTKDPIKTINSAIKAVKKASGLTPNALIAKADVIDALTSNANTKDYIKYIQPNAVDGNGTLIKLRGLTIIEAPESIKSVNGKELSKFSSTSAYLTVASNVLSRGMGYIATYPTRKEVQQGKILQKANKDTPLIFKYIDEMKATGVINMVSELSFVPVIQKPNATAEIKSVI